MLVALAKEHQSALAAKDRGDISPWNTYLRKQWCRPESADDADVPQTIDLHQAARCTKSPHQRGEIPKGASVTTIGADTGKREAWWLRISMRPDMAWHVIDWSVKTTADHRAEPTPADQRDMLDRMRERSARVGRAEAMGVDVGYNTDLVQAWARANGFACMRGDSRPTGKKDGRYSHLPSWADARQQDDGTVWIFIDTNSVKAEIHKSLAREPDSPGAGHLPIGQEAGDWLIRHICSEVWDSKHGVWVKRPGRDNHLLDCLVYAWALAIIKIGRPQQTTNRKYGAIKRI
jgi:phage terminase large subunit GpA-like protein